MPPGGQFGVGSAVKERRIQLCEALELAGALRRDPLAVVTLERRVGDARLRLEPGDLHVRLQRRRHEGVLRRVDTADADTKRAQAAVPVARRERLRLDGPALGGREHGRLREYVQWLESAEDTDGLGNSSTQRSALSVFGAPSSYRCREHCTCKRPCARSRSCHWRPAASLGRSPVQKRVCTKAW